MKIIEISQKYDISISTLILRLKKYGMKKGRNVSYSNEEILQIIYTRHSQIQRKKTILFFSKEALDIVQCFLSEKNNSIPNISKITGVEYQKVQRVISYYLKEKELNIESRMNNTTLEKL